jgi:dethiobiotin synthetase
MKNTIPNKVFITGTNTDIGKTVVCAVLMAGLRGKYWKPVQSGIIESIDAEWIREKTGLPEPHFFPETYRLTQPLSPHAAAALDGIEIKLDAFKLPEVNETETLIVEGAGGIMVPLNNKHFMLDLMKKLNLPVLLVSSSELGTINHTLLSLEQMRHHDLDILGVVMNGPKNPGNKDAIERFGKIPVIAEIEPLPEINPQVLQECFKICFKK